MFISVTILTILPLCAERNLSKEGKKIHGYTLKRALGLYLSIMNSLIDMYMKCVQYSAILLFSLSLSQYLIDPKKYQPYMASASSSASPNTFEIYFDDVGGAGAGADGSSSAGASPAKKGRGQVSRCQVEGCNVDLSDAKSYYSRRKVCGKHSKSPKVVVSGTHQRFCQQCSRDQSLQDMHCMWYELAFGESFFRQGDLGRALKKFLAVEKHYADITEDQFDFHTYCLRKMTLRGYIEMLKMLFLSQITMSVLRRCLFLAVNCPNI